MTDIHRHHLPFPSLSPPPPHPAEKHTTQLHPNIINTRTPLNYCPQMTLVTSDLKDKNGCMYLSNANATIVLIETDTEIVLITGVAWHMKSPKGQY